MWHKAPCSSRDYSGVRESGPRKRDEGDDDDGDDVDEDDHRGDDFPPDGTPVPPRERRRGSPLCFLLHGLPLDGERFSLWSLIFMVMMVPPGSSSMPSGDDDPLRQGAREGLDWFSVATEASGDGTPDLG